MMEEMAIARSEVALDTPSAQVVRALDRAHCAIEQAKSLAEVKGTEEGLGVMLASSRARDFTTLAESKP